MGPAVPSIKETLPSASVSPRFDWTHTYPSLVFLDIGPCHFGRVA